MIEVLDRVARVAGLGVGAVDLDAVVPHRRVVELARRIVTVSGFVKILTEVIEFGSNADSAEALAAMRELPALLSRRRKLAAADKDLPLHRLRRAQRSRCGSSAADRPAPAATLSKWSHAHGR